MQIIDSELQTTAENHLKNPATELNKCIISQCHEGGIYCTEILKGESINSQLVLGFLITIIIIFPPEQMKM